MNSILGLVVFALGIILLICGFAAAGASNAQVPLGFSVHPFFQSVWFPVLGGIAVVAGLAVAFWGGRKVP